MIDHDARRQAIVTAWGAAWDKGEVDALDSSSRPPTAG